MPTSSEQQLRKVLATVFDIDPASIGAATSIDTVEKWTSLNHLNLVLAIEESFNVSLTETQTVEMLSYPLIIAVLEEHGVSFR
jgi:acyl carrier protein